MGCRNVLIPPETDDYTYKEFAVEMPKGLILTCWGFIPKVKISLTNKFTQKHLGKLNFKFKHKIYPV